LYVSRARERSDHAAGQERGTDDVFTFPPDALNGCNNFNNQISGSFAIDDNGDPIQENR
jgi:hypothetical protein